MRRVGFFGGAVVGPPGLPASYLAVSMVSSEDVPSIGIYRRDGDSLIRLSGPIPAPTLEPKGLAFSPDGTHLAVGLSTGSAAASFAVYDRVGDTFTKTAQNLSGYTTDPIAYSPDGSHLLLGGATKGSMPVLKRSGATYSALSAIAFPESTASFMAAAYTANGSLLIVATLTSREVPDGGQLHVYTRSGDAYARASTITLPGTYSPRAVAVAPNGVHVAVASDDTVRIYKLSGTTLTLLTSLTSWPSGVAFSPDSGYLAVGTYPNISLFKRSGDTFTSLPAPSAGATNMVFSGDGNYLSFLTVSDSGTTSVTTCKRVGDTFTILPPPAVQPEPYVWGLAGYPLALYG